MANENYRSFGCALELFASVSAELRVVSKVGISTKEVEVKKHTSLSACSCAIKVCACWSIRSAVVVRPFTEITFAL